jgi:hypothetical protein
MYYIVPYRSGGRIDSERRLTPCIANLLFLALIWIVKNVRNFILFRVDKSRPERQAPGRRNAYMQEGSDENLRYDRVGAQVQAQ